MPRKNIEFYSEAQFHFAVEILKKVLGDAFSIFEINEDTLTIKVPTRVPIKQVLELIELNQCEYTMENALSKSTQVQRWDDIDAGYAQMASGLEVTPGS